MSWPHSFNFGLNTSNIATQYIIEEPSEEERDTHDEVHSKPKIGDSQIFDRPMMSNKKVNFEDQ